MRAGITGLILLVSGSAAGQAPCELNRRVVIQLLQEPQPGGPSVPAVALVLDGNLEPVAGASVLFELDYEESGTHLSTLQSASDVQGHASSSIIPGDEDGFVVLSASIPEDQDQLYFRVLKPTPTATPGSTTSSHGQGPPWSLGFAMLLVGCIVLLHPRGRWPEKLR